jgi:hypothetical protein
MKSLCCDGVPFSENTVLTLFDLETDFDGKTTRCESSGNLQKPLASGDISINITGV